MNRDALCKQIGHEFAQPQLLQRALTHRSHNAAHNERLEFLGDSVVNCVVAKYLHNSFPELQEGDLSRLRSNLVNQQTLYMLAQQLQLGELLMLGEGERKSAGSSRPSILADALEALVGALFLDGGFNVAENAVLGLYIPYIKQADVTTLGKDGKTLLQEYLQSRKLPLPQYTVIATQGEAHAQVFQVECVIAPLKMATHGEGTSRRIAEQMAADTAYRKLVSPHTGSQTK
jgi:ribonuclease III